MAIDPCPPADELAELVEGSLALDAVGAIHRHVRSCNRCRMVLAGLGNAVSLTEDPHTAGQPLVVKPGAKINRFRLERLVGRGGMGSVWAAADPELGRQVAIKILFAGIGSDGSESSSRARLLREAKAMARLSHPNVVPVFEIGEVRDRLFLVMELVEGQTLAHWLKEPRTLREILEKFIAAGDGLAAAHAARVIHRDFKPDNVLVGNDGRARVTDFGLARGHLKNDPDSGDSAAPWTLDVPGNASLREGAQGVPVIERAPPRDPLEGASTALDAGAVDGAVTIKANVGATPPGTATLPSALTPMGALLGTPAYMSPEQMRGQRADARSDLFAFCTSLFEALQGARPYPGKTLLEMRQRIESNRLEWAKRGRSSNTSSVPRWLKRELTRGLRANPLERHAKMAELLAALRLGQRSEDARWPWLLPLAALLLVVAAGALLVSRRTGGLHAIRSVAVLAPRNESPHVDAGWIAPALAELVAGDLGGDAQVRLIPPGEVAAAVADLNLKDAAPVAADLARLRARLGADLLLGGTYSLADSGALSCELRLWDPNGNATLLAEHGDAAHLIDLGARLAAEARAALGMKPRAPLDANGTNGFPTNLEAARLYADGLQSLRNFEAAKAAESLQKAAELTPDNPRVQLALADAYTSLRREGPARQAASRAFELKSALPPDEQPRAELLYYRTMGDHARAVALASARHEAMPGDLERGLELADELNAADQWKEVLPLLAELHKLPPPFGNDARIDIDEATTCGQLDDLQCSANAAARAYESAKARGARWQMAVALYRRGIATRKLGDVDHGLAMLDEAELLYTEVGDLGGAAGALVMKGTIFADRGDLPRARATFESAIATFASIGDRRAEAITLYNLSVLMRRARELPAALGFANRAATMNLELGQMGPAAGSLTLLGNLRIDLGDVTGAAEVLTRAADLRRSAKSLQLTSALIALATARLLQADFPAAHQLLDEARTVDNKQEKVTLGRLDALSALLSLSEGRFEDASRDATAASTQLKDAALFDDQAMSEATAARALLQLGRVAEARAATDRALAIIAASKSQMARTPTLVTDARVRAAEHPKDLAEPLRIVAGVIEETGRTGALEEQWQARLAQAELEQTDRTPGAKERLAALARDAKSQGLLLYSNQAAEAARARR